MTTKSIEDRCIRIESKLTRLMLGMGMDGEGNPAKGSLILDAPLADRVLDALDLLLLELDKRDGITFLERPEYAETEALYNQLIDIRNSRWPSR
jgi:hypothetical protein